MSRTFHHGERRIYVKGIRRQPADLRKLARALIELAKAEAEKAAQVNGDGTERRPKPKKPAGSKVAAASRQAARRRQGEREDGSAA